MNRPETLSHKLDFQLKNYSHVLNLLKILETNIIIINILTLILKIIFSLVFLKKLITSS